MLLSKVKSKSQGTPVTGSASLQLLPVRYEHHLDIKSRALSVTGSGGLQDYEMLTIPHCVNNRPTDDGGVVSLTYRSRSTPHRHFVFDIHRYYRLSEPYDM
jgi:hypothetical protein